MTQFLNRRREVTARQKREIHKRVRDSLPVVAITVDDSRDISQQIQCQTATAEERLETDRKEMFRYL